ncbi:MAG: hypothetical protein CME63_01735 [Halobacteriovoraceae bacterium]|nr:hypothetical protein [Halobacteriovoraceae bacterium]
MQLVKERQGMEKRFFELCSQLVKEHGLSLYGLDYRPGQQLLCLYIENPETKTAVLEDCVLIDRAMTPFVEEEEWMPSELTLEVSSPGVYRDIFEARQFGELVGERISFSLTPKIDDSMILATGDSKALKKWMGQKKVIGYLIEFNEGEEQIIISPELESSIKVAIKVEDIKKANVEPAWEDIKENG